MFDWLLQNPGDDGALYTGLWDGRVVRLDPDGNNPTTVFFTGGVVSDAGRAVGSTTGAEYGTRLMHVCHDKVCCWNKNKKQKKGDTGPKKERGPIPTTKNISIYEYDLYVKNSRNTSRRKSPRFFGSVRVL